MGRLVDWNDGRLWGASTVFVRSRLLPVGSMLTIRACSRLSSLAMRAGARQSLMAMAFHIASWRATSLR